jgi:hypothetical protein
MAETQSGEGNWSSSLSNFTLLALAAVAAAAKASALANQRAGSLFRTEHVSALSLIGLCHLVPAGLRASFGSRRAESVLGQKALGEGAPAAPEQPQSSPRAASSSGLPTQGCYFCTSASCLAPATLKPITQGAYLFAAAKSN